MIRCNTLQQVLQQDTAKHERIVFTSRLESTRKRNPGALTAIHYNNTLQLHTATTHCKKHMATRELYLQTGEHEGIQSNGTYTAQIERILTVM